MNKKEVQQIATNYIFILPAVALFAIFWAYPFLKLFQLSVFEWDGIVPWDQAVFVGLENFKNMFIHDSAWWQSMRQAGIITLIALVFQNALALLLALACDKGIRAARMYRMIYFIPPVLAGIVAGLIWNWIYDGNYGLLNYWLTKTGLGYFTRAWLSDKNTALIAVAIIHCWRGFGWSFIILLAGLQIIPRELYEAAKVDGANAWDSFKRVTVPLMVPVFAIVVILTILGTMQVYDIIVATTRGGPYFYTEVPITRILAALTGSSRFGYASALGVTFGLILFVVSMVLIKVSQLVKQD